MLRRLIHHHLFAERVLFLAVGGGIIIDGFLGGTFHSMNRESIVRICIFILGAGSLLFSFAKENARFAIRSLAYLCIAALLGISAMLCYQHQMDYDDALTMLGAYIICSMYFRNSMELLIYLVAGLALQFTTVQLVEHPVVDPHLYMIRNTLGALLVFGLSYSMRLYQASLQQFTMSIVQQNRSLAKTKEELQKRLTNEQLLAMVASRANTAVVISDKNDRIEWVNERFTELMGFSAKEVIGREPAFLHGEQTDPNVVAEIVKRKKQGEPFHAIILHYTKSHQPVWIQKHVTPLFGPDGIERYISVQEDVTAIKQNEEDLRTSREQLKLAQQQAKIGSWELIEDRSTIRMSEEMTRLLGIPGSSEVPIENALAMVHPGELGVVRSAMENGFRKRSPFEMEFRAVINNEQKYFYLTAQSYSHGRETRSTLIGTLQDITQRKFIEEEMRIAEKQYRGLFENSQHMIFMHDLEGRIMSINQAAAHAVGFEPEEIIGMDVKRFIFAGSDEDFNTYMKLIREKGRADGIVKFSDKHRRTGSWLYNNILLQSPSGQSFVLSSNVDISARIELEKELRTAKKAAEEALQLKDRFVTNISHELRTPMNAIVGFTELMTKTPLDDSQKDFVNAINIAGTRLTRMINDILDLAKIDSGKIEFDHSPFDLRKAFEEIHLLLSGSAAEKGLEMEWKCDDQVPDYLIGDELRLSQVLINLVGNSIKFTDDGYVRVSAHLLKEDTTAVEIEILVVDTGIGIPEDKLKSVFEPFSQASSDASRRFGGTGLGLSIVKNLVELQGGTVEVKSEVGRGSVFRVLMSFEKVGRERVQEVEQVLHTMESPGNTHILVAEDHILNQQLAARLLTEFGFTYEIAGNGKIATDLLRLEPRAFDLVLMDLQMPLMDGYEAVRIIREELQSAIPVIAVTAHSSAGEKERCERLGFNGYLTKPYRSHDLYMRIISSLKKQQDPGIHFQPGPTEGSPLKKLSGGDRKFEIEMLDLMLRSVPVDLEKFLSALETDNAKECGAIAHKLKSTVALVGDTELNLMYEDCESQSKSGSLSDLKKKGADFRQKTELFLLKIREELRVLSVD